MKWPGFTDRETSVLAACFRSHQLVPGGNYLTSGRQQTAAARRLIEREMLTLADSQPVPPFPDSVVVFLTQENWDAVRAASQAASAS